MEVLRNISLGQYSTMKLGGMAKYLVIADSLKTLIEASEFAESKKIPLIVIGEGSNTIWRDEGFNGLVIVNKIKGFRQTLENDSGCCIDIGAGEEWDKIVEKSVELKLTGIECLSLIPGTAGAMPVQNVGAYGQDISQSLITVSAYDRQTHKMTILTASDCHFGYRTSIFKNEQHGRFLITSISLLLHKDSPLPPFYPSVKSYLDEHNLVNPGPETLREAVIAIRSSRLPDPRVVPNCGSFFANPTVSLDTLRRLEENYGSIPHWTVDSGERVSAAWLIDKAGFKDYIDPETGIATWPGQPLILVNRSAKRTTDLLMFANKICSEVERKFSIHLTQEPELLP